MRRFENDSNDATVNLKGPHTVLLIPYEAWLGRLYNKNTTTPAEFNLTKYLRVTECKITSGDRELYAMHSFEYSPTCRNSLIEFSQNSFGSDGLEFEFRSFRFSNNGAIDSGS